MARLPVPGSDDANWGNILNTFLSVEHNNDGTHKGQGPAFIVAASDAPAAVIAGAQYVCDGTDDQVEINQALTDLGALGGKVLLSAGTFNCTGAVRMRQRTALFGMGRASVLKAIGTWAGFDGSAQGGIVECYDDGIDKTHVAQLSIDGNRWSGGDTKGIYYRVEDKTNFDEGPDAGHFFTDLYIFRTNQHGVHTRGEHMRANKFTRVRVYNCGDEGVNVAHGFFIEHPDSSWSQCEVGSATGSGFYIAGSNNRFTNCKSWYSDLNGYHIAAVRNSFSSCESQDNEGHGFYCGAGPNSFVACHADSNSWKPEDPAAGNAQFNGFHLPWGNRIQLVGCSAYDKDEGGRGHQQGYGFFLGSATSHCQVIGTTADNVTGSVGGNGATVVTNLIMVAGG